jgi:hypothetical protein
MRGELFIGNTAYNKEDPAKEAYVRPMTDRRLQIVPFATTTLTENDPVIDLLFYNRVNEIGDKLTSLVSIGNIRTSSDRSYFTYYPDSLFKNTSTELSLGITSDNTDFSGYNYVKQHEALPLYKTIADFTELKRSGKTANTLGPQNIAFDGWYTFMSVSVIDGNISGTEVKRGSLVLRNPSDVFPSVALNDTTTPGVTADWVSLDLFSSASLDISNIAVGDVSNTLAKFDVFILFDLKIARDLELVGYRDYPHLVNRSPILDRWSMILSNAGIEEFHTAQYFTQGVEDSTLIRNLSD